MKPGPSARRPFDPDHCTACGDFLPCGESWTVSANEAYDRLHGVDGNVQACPAGCRMTLECGDVHPHPRCTVSCRRFRVEGTECAQRGADR